MENFLHDILADPFTGDKLLRTDTGYKNAAGKIYPLQHSIPDFISHEKYDLPESALHIQENTTFKYREHYNADASFFNYTEGDDNAVTREERRRNRQAIIDAVNKNAAAILDIGCGDGWVAAYFSKKTKVVSLDLALTNPLKALENFPLENHAAVVADGMYLPFLPGSFDTIIASEVIEHLADPAGFIAGCMDKLNKNGQLILITPYNEKIKYHICVHCNHPTPESAHLHSFNEKIISALIQGKWHFSTEAFNNKYLLKMRWYNIFSFLPFSIWKWKDKFANAILRKPLTFMIVIKK